MQPRPSVNDMSLGPGACLAAVPRWPFPAASAFRFSTDAFREKLQMTQLASLVGCGYVIARGLNNMHDGRKRRKWEWRPLQPWSVTRTVCPLLDRLPLTTSSLLSKGQWHLHAQSCCLSFHSCLYAMPSHSSSGTPKSIWLL